MTQIYQYFYGVWCFQITEEFEEVPVQSRGFGILDVGYRSEVTTLSFNLPN